MTTPPVDGAHNAGKTAEAERAEARHMFKAFLEEIKRSFEPDVYRAYLVAQEFRVIPPDIDLG